mmetsp:Transcript_43119/g.99327  ORF Transcript_43119/g.99327 Transcript_43119/m.99327 type:complete len:287 (+) Transcript_43119:57-917(+)
MAWQKNSWGSKKDQWGQADEWGGGGGGAEGGELWKAINDTVQTLSAVDPGMDASKLESKLTGYFRKGGSKLNFDGKDLLELVNEYADSALGSVFAGLGDKEWLYNGQCDLLLVLDAGIKDTFPAPVVSSVTQQDFEQIVLAAYDRAFEEQRFGPILTEAVSAHCQGPKAKKKVWTAVDLGRKEASLTDAVTPEDFIQLFVDSSIKQLADASGGYPDQALDKDTAVAFFTAVVMGGGMPLRLQGSMPEVDGQNWPPLAEAVEAAYSAYGADAGASSGWGGSFKRQKV